MAGKHPEPIKCRLNQSQAGPPCGVEPGVDGIALTAPTIPLNFLYAHDDGSSARVHWTRLANPSRTARRVEGETAHVQDFDLSAYGTLLRDRPAGPVAWRQHLLSGGPHATDRDRGRQAGGKADLRSTSSQRKGSVLVLRRYGSLTHGSRPWSGKGASSEDHRIERDHRHGTRRRPRRPCRRDHYRQWLARAQGPGSLGDRPESGAHSEVDRWAPGRRVLRGVRRRVEPGAALAPVLRSRHISEEPQRDLHSPHSRESPALHHGKD